MMRTWTIMGVGDAPGSFRWYQSLLGLRERLPPTPQQPPCPLALGYNQLLLG